MDETRWSTSKCTCGNCKKYTISMAGSNGMFEKDEADLIVAAMNAAIILEKQGYNMQNLFEILPEVMENYKRLGIQLTRIALERGLMPPEVLH